jgi:hypothetical protein
MTEQQYRQALDNARLRGARPVLDDELAARLLRGAAAAQRRLEAADAVWERLAAPAWRGRAAVESVEAGVLTVAAADWALCAELRASRIRRDLARAVPGIRNVQIIVAGAANEQGNGAA